MKISKRERCFSSKIFLVLMMHWPTCLNDYLKYLPPVFCCRLGFSMCFYVFGKEVVFFAYSYRYLLNLIDRNNFQKNIQKIMKILSSHLPLLLNKQRWKSKTQFFLFFSHILFRQKKKSVFWFIRKLYLRNTYYALHLITCQCLEYLPCVMISCYKKSYYLSV